MNKASEHIEELSYTTNDSANEVISRSMAEEAVNLALEQVREEVKEPAWNNWRNRDYKAIMIKDVEKIINNLKI